MLDFLKSKQFAYSALSFNFQRALNIRQKVFEFEEALVGKYNIPAQMAPVGDSMNPLIPRFIFESKQGHSQITVSQVNLSLNVKYDKEFTENYGMCERYILERLKLIYPLLEKVTEDRICYVGLVNKIQYLTDVKNDSILLEKFAENFLRQKTYDKNSHDLHVKYTISKNNNFINLTIANVRNYTNQKVPLALLPVPIPNASADNVGIQVILDVNDRRAFNEEEKYKSSPDSIDKILGISKYILETKIDDIIRKGDIIL